MTVSATDLVAAFSEDSTAAGEQYGDKMLKVSGVLGTHLSSDPDGQQIIAFGEPLEDSEFKDILTVYLSPDQVSKADELWRGQEVTVVGKCVTTIVGDSFLSEGRIVEVGDPIPVLEVSADDMISEYQADIDAANDKYRYKVVVVSGVLAAKDDDNQTFDISAKQESGEGPIRLEGNYLRDDQILIAALEKYNPGDEIKVKAECGRSSLDGTRISLYYPKILDQ